MKRSTLILLGCAASTAGLLACGWESAQVAAASTGAEHATATVDSIFPAEEEIRRFRGILGPEPVGLSGGAPSLQALIDRFGAAVQHADTVAFADMLMTRDEFGWLYYPTTRFTSRPYELAPGMVWFQMENGSIQGLGRLLARLGGRPFTVTGHECPSQPRVEGRNRIWEGCTVRVDRAEGPLEATLFGSILGRDGVFKFVSYTNGF